MDSLFNRAMSSKIPFILICCALFLLGSCRNGTNMTASVNYNIHTFYYAWFGNPEVDGQYYHWNHHIIPHWIDSTWNNAGSFPGSSDDPRLISKATGASANNHIFMLSTIKSGQAADEEASALTRHPRLQAKAAISIAAPLRERLP